MGIVAAVTAALALAVPTFAAATGPGSIPTTTITIPTHTVVYHEGNSAMEPTIHCASPGDGCLAKTADLVVVQEPVRKVARFYVLVFNAPQGAVQACGVGGLFVLRVIAVPGDMWAERNGYVYINGRKLDEPYITPAFRDFATYPAKKIPKGQYFTMGDNRKGSCDSRAFGLVPQADLVGKVVRVERPR
jgi:signal peptidase I